MKEISCFVDESGDYGAYDYHSPYYIVALVFHDQQHDISENIQRLNRAIKPYDQFDRAIHTAPLIRREADYSGMNIGKRQKIFNCLFTFMRNVDVSYKSFVVEKKHLNDRLDLFAKLSKQLFVFLSENIQYFTSYDRINVYYDGGQIELTKILVTIFGALLNNVEFRKVMPSEYKLFQVADMICTLELLKQKMTVKSLSKSELSFFSSVKVLRKTYLSAVQKKQF